MRLLANENFPRLAVEALRVRGHDVAWVRSDAPGSPDEEVIARATHEGRVLLTLDKDFGELAFRSRLPATSGIVLLRISPPLPHRVALAAVRLLESAADLCGEFVVVEAGRVRRRALPGAPVPRR